MILDEIAQAAKKRVAECKKKIPLEEMKKEAYERKEQKTGEFLMEKTLKAPGISFICEIKKASPSKGVIAKEFPYREIAKEYEEAGADFISVLTEPDYFLGSTEYLREIRGIVRTPLLRKDFVVDEYMIYEAKVIGADAVLLICSLLSEETLREWISCCDRLGLSALVEAHDRQEVEMAVRAGARIIGVNNRDLKNFTVDVHNCLKLRPFVPRDIMFVAESGIKTREDIAALEQGGVNGVLIGETFMRSPDKSETLRKLRGMERKENANAD